MLQSITTQRIVNANNASPPAEGTNTVVVVVNKVFIITEGDMLLHESLQQRAVVFLHLGDMAKKEIMLVRHQAFYFGLLDTEEDVGIADIIQHLNAFGPIFVIGEGADVTGLHHNLMLRKSTVQFGHLFWGQGHTVVHGGLGFFDEDNFHYILFLFLLFFSKNLNFAGMIVRK